MGHTLGVRALGIRKHYGAHIFFMDSFSYFPSMAAYICMGRIFGHFRFLVFFFYSFTQGRFCLAIYTFIISNQFLPQST
jgi:hypothetical protein